MRASEFGVKKDSKPSTGKMKASELQHGSAKKENNNPPLVQKKYPSVTYAPTNGFGFYPLYPDTSNFIELDSLEWFTWLRNNNRFYYCDSYCSYNVFKNKDNLWKGQRSILIAEKYHNKKKYIGVSQNCTSNKLAAISLFFVSCAE